jgi:hypothetical protein
MGISVYGVSVHHTKFEIMFLQTSNITARIAINVEHSARPTLTQPMPNYHHAMFTEELMWFN